ncbi:MAG TPA: sugar transferase [Anaerolineales bacterium]|nr:sugar transferase [Anaerolineales bacterium]
METTPSGRNLLVDSVLWSKISHATNNIPRPMQWRLFVVSLIISDILMSGLAFRLAYFIRFELSLDIFYQNLNPSIAFYQRLVIIFIPVWLIVFALLGLYDRQKLLGGTQEYSLVFNGTTVGMILVIAVGFLDPGFVLARAWLLLAWWFTFLATASGRFILRRVVYNLRQRGYFLSPAVIIGANNEGLSLAEQLMRWRSSGFHLVGFIDKKLPVGASLMPNLPVLGTVDDLDRIIKQYQIEELILASSAISSRDKMLEIFQRYGISSDVNVRMSSGLYEIITTSLTVKEFAYVPLVGVNKVRLAGVDEALKLALDYSLTIPGLILIAPIFLAIALMVKLDSPGPVFHRRRVMGMNRRQFDAYKFRTMYVDGDEILDKYPEKKAELARYHKLKEDPRVTRFGEFLRKTSLDELPQLFNVLKRDMSLVGPRIITSVEVEKYNQWDLNLMTVRPGITGLWQVSGRSDVPYEERVRLDMHYIRNWSIWLDVQLLVQTIPAVLKRKGAY